MLKKYSKLYNLSGKYRKRTNRSAHWVTKFFNSEKVKWQKDSLHTSISKMWNNQIESDLQQVRFVSSHVPFISECPFLVIQERGYGHFAQFRQGPLVHDADKVLQHRVERLARAEIYDRYNLLSLFWQLWQFLTVRWQLCMTTILFLSISQV